MTPTTAHATPEGPKAEGLRRRWIARPAPASLGDSANQLSVSLIPLNKRAQSDGKQIRFRDPVTAFQTQWRLHCPQGVPPRLDALQEASKEGDERLAYLQYRWQSTREKPRW